MPCSLCYLSSTPIRPHLHNPPHLHLTPSLQTQLYRKPYETFLPGPHPSHYLQRPRTRHLLMTLLFETCLHLRQRRRALRHQHLLTSRPLLPLLRKNWSYSTRKTLILRQTPRAAPKERIKKTRRSAELHLSLLLQNHILDLCQALLKRSEVIRKWQVKMTHRRSGYEDQVLFEKTAALMLISFDIGCRSSHPKRNLSQVTAGPTVHSSPHLGLLRNTRMPRLSLRAVLAQNLRAQAPLARGRSR